MSKEQCICAMLFLFFNNFNDDDSLKENPIFNKPFGHYSYIDIDDTENAAYREVVFKLPVVAKEVTSKDKKQARKYLTENLESIYN